jgi:hypothetical protein
MLHDNHLMRFVPLIPCNLEPAPWRGFQAVELAWTGALDPRWAEAGIPVHGLHLPAGPWDDQLGATVLRLLQPRLELDFLVIPATCPEDRLERARFLGVLEGLLEAVQGHRVKLALQPGPAATPGLARLLKEVHGQAVGYCWNGQTGPELDCISDRLFCAVGGPGDDYAPLQRLGYRWNLALAARDPEPFRALQADLERAYPTVYFPADLEPAPAPRAPEEHP